MADINVLDLERLSPGIPKLVRDFPAETPRLIIQPDGVRATVVAGVPLFEDGRHTGAYPGRLLRNGGKAGPGA